VTTEIDTIVAPATPLGRSALAVLRIDGPRSSSILGALGVVDPEPRRSTHARLSFENELLDDCVVTRYVAPHSYTGNDHVELYLHGSPYLVQRMMQVVTSLGARIAEAGEFTERAVLNGKLDLVQAEAVFDLIESRTGVQAKLALTQLDGALSKDATLIREELLHVISRLEAALDFAEEGYEFIDRSDALARIEACVRRLDRMLDTFSRGRAITNGITAVILGQPNAGKSTLLNYLCGSERAIVTDIPGTTRDLLREVVRIGGLPVTLVDTAGLRESSDVVEGIGVERARQTADRADLVIYLIDASKGVDAGDRIELSRLRDPLVVFTKSDLAQPADAETSISVVTGEGVEAFVRRLDELIRERYLVPEGDGVVVNERQRTALMEAREALEAAGAAIGNMLTEEVVLVDLYRGASAIGRLTGAISHSDVMHEIFSKFCIGK
jgi:tRNA modification GTPase